MPDLGLDPVGDDGFIPPPGGGSGVTTRPLATSVSVLRNIDIDEAFNGTCAESIIERLQFTPVELLITGGGIGGINSSLFNSPAVIMSIFTADNSPFDLAFEVGDLTNANANTRAGNSDNGVFTFTITVDPDYLNRATDLSIARTLIHELIHARLLYLETVGVFSRFLGTTSDPEFEDLIDAFQRSSGVGVAEHTFMVRYVDEIALALDSYATFILGRTDLNDTFFQAMSWGGLIDLDNGSREFESPAFRTAVPSFQRDTYRNIIAAEDRNKEVDGQRPRGDKCNE